MKRKPNPEHHPHRRLLTPEEAELWYQVQKTATPMPGRKSCSGMPADPPAARDGVPSARKAAGKKGTAIPLKPPAAPAAMKSPGPGVIDEPTLRKLKKGRLAIDDVLDLHGKTQDGAHAALTRFLGTAHDSGSRIVLIITGKGTGGDGVLRRQVPNWLRQPPLSALVSGMREAHSSHGGSGALYVRLRKGGRDSAKRARLFHHSGSK